MRHGGFRRDSLYPERISSFHLAPRAPCRDRNAAVQATFASRVGDLQHLDPQTTTIAARQPNYSPRTLFCSLPMPLTLTSIVSPATNCPTPAGVPVAITSPGSSVITCAIHLIITSMEKIISAMRSDCFFSPFRSVSTLVSGEGGSVSSTGPGGHNGTNPFARPHWLSLFCRSRAVASLSGV